MNERQGVHYLGVEGHSFQQTDVSITRRHHGMQAHEPRPKLNDPNASLHTARGQQHTMNRVHGSLYHGVETNALVNVRKVVLDGFGDQNHAQFHLSLDSPELNIRCALARLNIPKNIKLINSSFLQHIEGFFHVARVCRVSQDGASFLVDVSHSLLRELQPFLQARQSPTDAAEESPWRNRP
eukprot:748533-Hanusia_phi.AAC.7